MSELRVDNIVDMGGSGAPQLRKGANVTGISTITQAVVGNATINAGGINATGIVTSSSNKFVGDFASGNITAGVMTATSSVVASSVTLNAGGINIGSGIISATSYAGSGANLTGIGLTIAPLSYTPNVSGHNIVIGTGVSLSFNQRVSAGVGTVTLSLVSVGSTVAEVFGLGNATSTTYTVTVASSKFYLDGNQQYSPTLYPGNIYTFDQSAATNGTHPLRFATAADAAGSTEYTTGVETNGTPGSSGAYTRITVAADAPATLYYYCSNHSNMGSTVSIGANVQFNNDANPPNITINPRNDLSRDTVYAISYPSGAFTQSGAGGSFVGTGYTFYTTSLADHTLWSWGANESGSLGLNNTTKYSSPVQVGSSYWIDVYNRGANGQLSAAIKNDGTLWMWGANWKGGLGQNASGGDWPAWSGAMSSPVQVGSDTTWGEGTTSLGNKTHLSVGYHAVGCIKTDGTLWMWGHGDGGKLAQNDIADRSSPVQIPGTNWKQIVTMYYGAAAIKTDGTLWTWGDGGRGATAQNNEVKYSSPVQVPGTTWSVIDTISGKGCAAIKTDGTLWSWGYNYQGALGNNLSNGDSGSNPVSTNNYSSPIQIPGTTWSNIAGHGSNYGATVVRTDGTMWSWGYNSFGQLGHNNRTAYSSPTQIPGTDWPKTDRKKLKGGGMYANGAIKTDGTYWAWGRNTHGQLGLNNVTHYSSPVQVPGTNFITITSHNGRSMALRES